MSRQLFGTYHQVLFKSIGYEKRGDGKIRTAISVRTGVRMVARIVLVHYRVQKMLCFWAFGDMKKFGIEKKRWVEKEFPLFRMLRYHEIKIFQQQPD
jgi:hypothetical protein